MDRTATKAPDQNRAIIQALLWAIKPLVDSKGPIPFPYMLTFLMVALEEGKSVGAYGRELNFSRFQISRYMGCISDRGRWDRPRTGYRKANPRCVN